MRFKPAKIFKNAIEQPLPPTTSSRPPPPRHITGMSFDDRGELCITAGEDESFRLWSCKAGKRVSFLPSVPQVELMPNYNRMNKILYSKKYGVDLPRFTHKSSTIIYASTKEDDTIRYHSLHDNKYLSYFRGHQKKYASNS